MSTEVKHCRYCGQAIRLDGEDEGDNILIRDEELAHRTCVYDQSKPRERGASKGWRVIQWWSFGHGGAAGALGRTPEEPE